MWRLNLSVFVSLYVTCTETLVWEMVVADGIISLLERNMLQCNKVAVPLPRRKGKFRQVEEIGLRI
jgi:hypothetical protein